MEVALMLLLVDWSRYGLLAGRCDGAMEDVNVWVVLKFWIPCMFGVPAGPVQ